MKGLVVLLLMLVLAGCGDFQWFPEDGTTTTTTPPVTPTQQVFNNVSTVTMPTTVTEGNIQLSNFKVVENPSVTDMKLSFEIDVANLDKTSGATVKVTITAVDGAGTTIQVTTVTTTLGPDTRMTLFPAAAAPLSLADYKRIRAWSITSK